MAKYADKIADDLVEHLSKLDCLAIKEFKHGNFRSDVLGIAKDLTLIDYEIKTSVADYNNDYKKANGEGVFKHYMFGMGWLTHRLTFVMPPNLIPIEDIPLQYGVMYYYGHTFRLIRKGTVHSVELDDYFEDIIANATAKFEPEKLCKFQAIFMEYLRHKIRCVEGDNINLSTYFNMHEKEIRELRDALSEFNENHPNNYR